MQLILLQKVTNLGNLGDKVDVIVLKASGRRAIELGSFATHAEAEYWQRRMQAELRAG